MERFIQDQTFEVDQEELWAFISTPSNLNSITPEWLDFRMVSEQVPAVFNGLLIEYEIRLPFLGRRKWVSEIKHVNPGKCFVDEQLHGPYRFWHHYHELQKISEKRTRMVDLISYDVGWGLFGKLADKIYVKRNIQKIFTFRKDALGKLFDGT